jgi:hypothetical protein
MTEFSPQSNNRKSPLKSITNHKHPETTTNKSRNKSISNKSNKDKSMKDKSTRETKGENRSRDNSSSQGRQ